MDAPASIPSFYVFIIIFSFVCVGVCVLGTTLLGPTSPLVVPSLRIAVFVLYSF